MALTVIPVKQPNSIAFSGNTLPYFFSFSPYGSLEKSQDIRLQVKVLIENTYGSNIFSEIKSQMFVPDSAGNVSFSVHSLIDPYLEYLVPQPRIVNPVQATGQRKRYKLAYTAYRDGAIVATGETSIRTALKGGMDYASVAAGFFPDYPTNVIPLHNATDYKLGADDPYFFFFTYPWADAAQIAVFYRVTLDDGTTVDTGPTAPFTPQQWSVWAVPCGFHWCRLHTLVPEGRVARYWNAIIIKTANGQGIGNKFFELEQRQFYNVHTLLYRSSLGGMETLVLRGQVDFEADYVQQQAQRISGLSVFQNFNLQPQTVHFSTEETPHYKGDTGFISKMRADGLREFFLSPERWEWKQYTTLLLPIELNVKNTKFWTNNDSLYALQIEWLHAYVNEFYTADGTYFNRFAGTCPALENFVAIQLNSTSLQVLWAAPEGHDKLQVQVIVGATTSTYYYNGMAGNVQLTFANPANVASLQVKGRLICDEYTDPPSYGLWSTVNIAIRTNSPVVAVNDSFTMFAGFTTPVALGNVLANDYDPDGDPIEAVATSGITNAGGDYTITAAGDVTYTPPSAAYTGQDYFDYGVRNVGGSTMVTARVFITIGQQTVYAKLVIRNEQYYSSGYQGNASHEVWVDFFSDPQGTQPTSVSSLTVKVKAATNTQNFSGQQENFEDIITAVADGIKVKVFDGEYYNYQYEPNFDYDSYTQTLHTLLANNGYTVI